MNADIERANTQLRDLWVHERERAESPLLDLFPLQYPDLDIGRLVFVGMNPSHEAANQPVLRITSAADLSDPKRILGVVRLEEAALGRRSADPVPYYRPLKEFTADWEHVDIFAVRDASQRSALELLQPDGVLTEFAEAQLRIFDALLGALRPRTVVVINAMASAILKKRLSSRCVFNEQHGHHSLALGERVVPVFFSGMLTGQRALDVHSRERLVWHVKAALKRFTPEETP